MGHYRQWIPETIKSLRKANDLTLAQLAEQSDLSVSYISDIEKGRTLPTIETLDRLLIALGTTLTLGTQADYIPPGYVWVSREMLHRLAAITQDITPDE